MLGHGYEVEITEDNEAVLTLLAARPSDVMVLDLVMPGVDGVEVLRL